MTTIQIASDLHLEFYKDINNVKEFLESLRTDADVLVLAGDVTISEYLFSHIRLIGEVFQHQDIVYITGNHEYYHSSFNTVHKKLEKLNDELSNFHWLRNNDVTLKGQHFVGSTLWFPETEHSTDYFLQSRLSDFYHITRFRTKVFTEHDYSRNFIKKVAREKSVVITHHLPLTQSVPSRFRKDLLNCFYYAQMETAVELCQPKLWLHGHTHDSCDYTTGNTRVVCNPYGYYNYEQNKEFNPKLVIELKEK